MSFKKLLPVAVLIVVGFFSVIAVRMSFVGRNHYAKKLEMSLDGLREKRAANLTQAQWECMVDWTGKLHGNSPALLEPPPPER